jgi:hypothetical protein
MPSSLRFQSYPEHVLNQKRNIMRLILLTKKKMQILPKAAQKCMEYVLLARKNFLINTNLKT